MSLSNQFDSIFAKYGGQVPVAYLRALGYRESQLNPNESQDPAWGLLQVVESVRNGYNSRYGASYTRSDLLDPAINTKIAADLLNRIAKAYAKHSDPNMKPDWSNPEFVKLLTAGWNSGYSEAAGVGHVASWLEAHGIPVTHDNVFQYAGQAGGTVHLQNGSKQTWQRSVADLYFAQPDAVSGMGSFLTLAVVGIFAWLAWRYIS